MSALRWIVTRDLTYHASDSVTLNMVGVGHNEHGNRCRVTGEARIAAEVAAMRYEFQLLDDDGEVYYEGRSNTVGEDEVKAFAPLDWAEGDGCTTMHWRPVGETSWRIL